MAPSVGRARPPGLGDVAALAGVSHQTVSRVVNASPHVRPETRARVLSAMADLGYRPNLAARALVTRRTGLMGVLATGLPHSGPASILTGIETAARAAGYSCLVSVLDADADAARPILESFAARRVDAVAVVAPYGWLVDAAAAVVLDAPVLVVADAPVPAPLHRVAVDQAGGARAAVRHLVERGHTDVAHVSGPPGWLDADHRVRGWREALRDAGLRPGALLGGDWSAEAGHAAGVRLAGDPPDAVFCGNDLTALGVIAGLRSRGLSVPADVSVVGFDDMPGAGWTDPPLTTVRQPFAEVGARCVGALLDALAGAPASDTTIEAELVVRASSR